MLQFSYNFDTFYKILYNFTWENVIKMYKIL